MLESYSFIFLCDAEQEAEGLKPVFVGTNGVEICKLLYNLVFNSLSTVHDKHGQMDFGTYSLTRCASGAEYLKTSFAHMNDRFFVHVDERSD